MEKKYSAKDGRDCLGLKVPAVIIKKTSCTAVTTDTYCPTLTMSNIGICKPNPSHIDVEGFHYMGPARILNMCFIGYAAPWPQLIALTYNNRMTISLAVFQSHFPLESAEAFLDSFIEEINEATLASPP